MATFTRKHYVEIARILHGVRDRNERQRLAEEFAHMFRQDNPAFDVERFSSAVYGESRESRHVSEGRHAAGAVRSSAGFAIGSDSQDLIEENVRERFGSKYGDPKDRARAIREGWIDAQGEITNDGWDLLNDDTAQIERNALAWMSKKFLNARDEGHDKYDDLVGTFWFDPTDPEQAQLIELAADTGRQERIDVVDASYGDLARTAFKLVSDFGSSVLGGSITFFGVSPEDMETIEETLATRKR